MSHFYIWGSQGKMGRSIQAEAVARKKPYKILEQKDIYPHSPTLKSKLVPNTLLLDVSLPEGTEALAHALLSLLSDSGSPAITLLVGSTGHSPRQLDVLKLLSQKAAVVICPNFSRGIFIFQQMLQAETSLGIPVSKLLKLLGFEFGLLDVHHKTKKDIPSGTALLLAKTVGMDLDSISSIRIGHVVGDHELYLSGESETLQIKHTAHSRQLFAHGALWAVNQLQENPLSFGLYDMSHIVSCSLELENQA